MVGAEQPDGTPPDIDMSDAARMYDLFLGGAHNFDADHRAALAVLKGAPQIRDAAWANRQFLRRAVQYALDQDIRQFLDLGSGFPTRGCAHEVVHAAHPRRPRAPRRRRPRRRQACPSATKQRRPAGAIEADLRDPAPIQPSRCGHRTGETACSSPDSSRASVAVRDPPPSRRRPPPTHPAHRYAPATMPISPTAHAPNWACQCQPNARTGPS